MKAPRILTALIVLIIVGIAGYWLWNHFNRPDNEPPATVPVIRGDIEETVLATGIVKPVRLVAVGAQVSGRITARGRCAGPDRERG